MNTVGLTSSAPHRPNGTVTDPDSVAKARKVELLGRMDEAAEALLTASRKPSAGLGAIARLVHLRKTTEDSPEWKQLQAFAASMDKMPQDGRSALSYALGKANEDLRNHAAAFEHYTEANRLTREKFPYDRDLAIERAERIREAVARDRDARRDVTVSIGATRGAGGDAPGDLLRRADVALYRSKRGGRNRVSLEAR